MERKQDTKVKQSVKRTQGIVQKSKVTLIKSEGISMGSQASMCDVRVLGGIKYEKSLELMSSLQLLYQYHVRIKPRHGQRFQNYNLRGYSHWDKRRSIVYVLINHTRRNICVRFTIKARLHVIIFMSCFAQLQTTLFDTNELTLKNKLDHQEAFNPLKADYLPFGNTIRTFIHLTH